MSMFKTRHHSGSIVDLMEKVHVIYHILFQSQLNFDFLYLLHLNSDFETWNDKLWMAIVNILR